jgi:hypothetical protein
LRTSMPKRWRMRLRSPPGSRYSYFGVWPFTRVDAADTGCGPAEFRGNLKCES